MSETEAVLELYSRASNALRPMFEGTDSTDLIMQAAAMLAGSIAYHVAARTGQEPSTVMLSLIAKAADGVAAAEAFPEAPEPQRPS